MKAPSCSPCWHSAPITPARVLSGPRSTHPTIGLSTVYKALAILTNRGVVHRVKSRKAYIICQCGGTHQAFVLSICDACGTVEERDASQLLKNLSGLFAIVLHRERRPRSHTKNIPPTIPVTMPIGMSSGAMTVRAAISAQSRKIAPTNADAGRTRV